VTVDRVGVVGSGLIGTSIGLALARRGRQARLVDADPARAATAAALGAGVAVGWADLRGCDHVVVAVPPAATAPVVIDLLRLDLGFTISDVASTKSHAVADIETLDPELSRHFCGGHPIAGRERGGPGAAQPELFDGALWAVCPTATTSAAARADVEALAAFCGARTVVLDAAAHDTVLAAVSHAPQLVASALAARLAAAGEYAPVLAGQGFRDTTRLADSDPDLWAEIAQANAPALSAELRALAGVLAHVAAGLDGGDPAGVRDLVAAGRAARALLPGKAATPRRGWARVGVVLADRPGELARLLGAAGDAGVNVEDLAIEHAVDHPVGYVDLEVRPEHADPLLAALAAAGWAAHRSG
jgi:prephenate dehydrogenase